MELKYYLFQETNLRLPFTLRITIYLKKYHLAPMFILQPEKEKKTTLSLITYSWHEREKLACMLDRFSVLIAQQVVERNAKKKV